MEFLEDGVLSLSFATPNSRDVFDEWMDLASAKDLGWEKVSVEDVCATGVFSLSDNLVSTALNYEGKFSFFHSEELVTLNLTN